MATAFGTTIGFHKLIGVAGANQNAACGISNWLISTERSVFDTPCSPMSTINMKIGKVDPNTLRVTVCAESEDCSTADYTRALAELCLKPNSESRKVLRKSSARIVLKLERII